MGTVFVVGSANLDLVARASKLPKPGETLLGDAYAELPGGKGLNQACAAAHAGAKVSFLGAVGEDGAAESLLEALSSHGVDVEPVVSVPGPSGRALIEVSDDGMNRILVVPGSNWALNAEHVDEKAPDSCDVLVMQAEVPMEVNEAAAAKVDNAGGRVVLNLAPVAALPENLLRVADPLVVNEHELAQWAGVSEPADLTEAVATVKELGASSRSLIVTMGAAGSVVSQNGQVEVVPATAVDTVVDTTGAGDAYVGVLSAALSEGKTLLEAAQLASAGAAASVTAAGASASYHKIKAI